MGRGGEISSNARSGQRLRIERMQVAPSWQHATTLKSTSERNMATNPHSTTGWRSAITMLTHGELTRNLRLTRAPLQYRRIIPRRRPAYPAFLQRDLDQGGSRSPSRSPQSLRSSSGSLGRFFSWLFSDSTLYPCYFRVCFVSFP